MPSDVWSLIHAERDAIADDLEGIDESAWAGPTLCGKWTVGEVLAHQMSAAMMTPPQFFAKFAAAGFRFPVYSDREVAKYYRDDPSRAIREYRQAAHRTTAPPGPKPTWIGEVVVHSEDIRRPLGITHAYDPAALRGAADFYTGSTVLSGARDRITGVRLEATDDDWTHGDGPTASGPLLAIVMAMTGRATFLDELSGEGVEVLRGR